MRKSPDELYNYIREIGGGLDAAIKRIERNENKLDFLNNQVQTQTEAGSPIVNDLRDSDWNYSVLAYTGAGVNTEAAHWYKHCQLRVTDIETSAGAPDLYSASGLFTTTVFGYGTVRAVLYGAKSDGSTISTTLTRVDDNNVAMAVNADIDATGLEMWFGTELNEASAQALETTATSKAKWDKNTSTALIGGKTASEVFSIDQPLLGNPCTPSSRQYFQILAELVSGSRTGGLSMYVGVWDETAGQQRWLEGANFDLTASKVGAHTGGATSYTFRIIATTDYGYQIQSDDATVTNAVNPLTSESYVALSWTNLVGINRYDIYMYDGTNYYLVYQIVNGSYTYFVDSAGIRLDSAWPTITVTKWRALVVLDPSQFVITTSGWIVPRATILIPNTYNQQLTTGKQWIRFGLTRTTADLAVRLDHVALCTAPGTAWVRSKLDDAAVSAPDGNASSGTQGGIGGGGGTINPPGTGGIGACIWETEPLLSRQGEVFWPEICEGLEVNDGFGNYEPIRRVERYLTSSSAIIETEDGARLQCSLTHPFIQHEDDLIGCTAFNLNVGDEILTSDGDEVKVSKVKSKLSGGEGYVLMITMGKINPRFVAGSGKRKCVVHNAKIQE